MAILISMFGIKLIVILQEILTSHIFELKLPRVHNVIVHFIPHVTDLPSQQGFTRHICIMENLKEVFAAMNLKAARNIQHKLRQSLCSYFLEMLEYFHLNSGQFSLRQQRMLIRK